MGVKGFLSDVINLRKEVSGFNKSERFDAYSKIIINVTDDLFYEAGDDTGRTLTLSCPWGTQAMADNLLAQMRGFSYQPYTAEGAMLDPASELGDGINVNGVYSGIYRMDTKFTSNCPTDISAPSDEEIDTEYPYESKQQREVKRKNKHFTTQLSIQQDQITAEVEERKSDIKTVKSTLEVQASQIVAKVNKVQNNTSTTFGWALETDSWRIFAGTSTVLKATKDGLEVKGKITATSGTIGGFTINNNYISYNNQTWGGTNTTGIYIGISGIQLGKNFKVDNAGNLTAASGTFTGSVNAGKIKYGEKEGYFSGSGLSSGSISGNRLEANTITTSYTSSGINGSLGRADTAYNICTGVTTAEKIITQELSATSKASVESLYINGSGVNKKSVTFKDGDNKNVTISYWG